MRQVGSTRFLILLAVLALVWSGCSERGDGLLAPGPEAPDFRLQGIPAGYYDNVDLTDASTLRLTLHEVIDDHTRFPYTSTATDTWDILETADEDPNDPTRILDVYRNASYLKEGGGNSFYNREHTWPKSYGFPNDNSSNYPYTDTHQLFLCDDGYNSSRSNKPYRYCDVACSEQPTDFNNGVGGSGGPYPGDSNWTSGSLTTGTWETWSGRRGDVARALLYLDVRYEGGTHGGTGVSEPDLILTDNEALIASSNTGSNESVGYMGMLAVLLQWHTEDPVDDVERARNDAVYSFQGNRNPFIDHPEWVDCLFLGTCGGGGDTTPPAVPAGLVAVAGDGSVSLDWADNTEPDLAGYNVYRSETGGAPFTQVNGGLILASAYTDNSVTNGITYTYAVSAVDTAANESGLSGTADATPQGQGGGPVVWINEFHYDNKKGDVGEFVEVAGTAGTDLSGWQLLGYNGSNSSVYQTVNLSGVIADQQDGFGAVAFSFTGMQNGAPDGIALVNASSEVIEFLSYEGTFTAADGPAAGMTSTDVGVNESSGTAKGRSLQQTGTGTQSSDFDWQPPMAETPGLPNTGQTFGSGGGDTTPPAAPAGLAAVAGDGQVDLDWDDNTEPDLDGYTVYRATMAGGPYSPVNGSLLSASAYTDTGVTNGTTYHYVVTASDLTGNESGNSGEVSATPTGSGGGGAMHVDAIILSAVPAGGPNERARAEVTILDAAGSPVAGADVTGSFTGDINDTVSGTTDANGVAVLTSNSKKKGPIGFSFCVDGVVKASWIYDSGANVVTCGNFGAL